MSIYLVYKATRPTIQTRLKPEYLGDQDLKDLYVWALSAYNQTNNPSPAPRENRAKELAEILPLKLDVEPVENPEEETNVILNNLASLHRQAERERLEAEMRAAEKIGDVARITEISKLFKEL